MNFLCKLLGCKEKVVYQDVEKIVYRDVEKVVYRDVEKVVYRDVEKTAAIRPDPIPRPELTGNPLENFRLVYRHYGVPAKPQAWVSMVKMDAAYIQALVDVLDVLHEQIIKTLNRLPVETELHHFTTNTDAKSMKRLADALKKNSYIDIIQITMFLNTPLCKCQN